MVTAYERSEKEPSLATLERISAALDFPQSFFQGPDLDEPPIDGSSFRAASRLTARQRDQALGSGALALAVSDWIDERFDLPAPDVPQHQGIDPETAAMAVRSEWGLGERPIRNVIHLLEAHGIRVFSLTEDAREMDAFSFWRSERPYVFLNTIKSAERSRMDAAHELGHFVLHWRGGPRGRHTEHEADLFAAAFLMPRGSIVAQAPRGGRLHQIIAAKKWWNVSAAALTYRMHQVGLLSDWQHRALFIEMSRLGYRAEEPQGSDAETSQILTKVFSSLRQEGMTIADISNSLDILPEELNRIVFGLVLTTVAGPNQATSGSADRTPSERPPLRLVGH